MKVRSMMNCRMNLAGRSATIETKRWWREWRRLEIISPSGCESWFRKDNGELVSYSCGIHLSLNYLFESAEKKE